MKLYRILYQQVVRVFGNGCSGAAGVLWDFREGVWKFFAVKVVLVWWIWVVVVIDYMYGSKVESRCLYSCGIWIIFLIFCLVGRFVIGE